MTTDITALLAAVRAADAARPALWHPCGAPSCTCGMVWTTPETALTMTHPESAMEGSAPRADAEAACLYRTAAPRLAAEVERLSNRDTAAILIQRAERERDTATKRAEAAESERDAAYRAACAKLDALRAILDGLAPVLDDVSLRGDDHDTINHVAAVMACWQAARASLAKLDEGES